MHRAVKDWMIGGHSDVSPLMRTKYRVTKEKVVFQPISPGCRGKKLFRQETSARAKGMLKRQSGMRNWTQRGSESYQNVIWLSSKLPMYFGQSTE